LTFPTPTALDQNPALITPPLSSPAFSIPKSASLESLRSGNTMEYDSDRPPTPTVDGDSLYTVPSIDPLPPTAKEIDDIILPDAEPEIHPNTCEAHADAAPIAKLRKVAFNDSIIYYPPRPQSSRQPSFSSQISVISSGETTLSIPSPILAHRNSLSSFLLPSSSISPSAHRHTRERKSWAGLITYPFTSAVRRNYSRNRYRPPTPPLGHGTLDNSDDEDGDELDPWQGPIPIIDLDAALKPFQTPGFPHSPNHPTKFWSLTSHVGTHRRSGSAPEIHGLDFNSSFSTSNITDSTPSSRGLKRKMSVIDEEDRQFRSDEMEIDSELHRIMLLEGAQMGEMGDLVKSLNGSGDDICSKRRDWRKSLKEWWKKV
jgi:hypothetical protein